MTGRMSQNKGKRAELALANWWKGHGYPDAGRAVKTGDRFTPDGGDLILDYRFGHGGTQLFRMCVEVKHHAGGLTELQVAQFGAKLLSQIRVSNCVMGVLVERRDRVVDPGKWWAHVPAESFAYLELGKEPPWRPMRFVPVRCSVAYLAELLTRVGLAGPWVGVVSSATSPPDGATEQAGMAVADGVSP